MGLQAKQYQEAGLGDEIQLGFSRKGPPLPPPPPLQRMKVSESFRFRGVNLDHISGELSSELSARLTSSAIVYAHVWGGCCRQVQTGEPLSNPPPHPLSRSDSAQPVNTVAATVCLVPSLRWLNLSTRTGEFKS